LGYGVSLGFGINATGEAVGRSYLAQAVPTTGCPPRHTCVAHPGDVNPNWPHCDGGVGPT
jgi:hypothetical protein